MFRAYFRRGKLIPSFDLETLMPKKYRNLPNLWCGTNYEEKSSTPQYLGCYPHSSNNVINVYNQHDPPPLNHTEEYSMIDNAAFQVLD